MEHQDPIGFLLHRLVNHPRSVNIHIVCCKKVVLLKSEAALYSSIHPEVKTVCGGKEANVVRSFTNSLRNARDVELGIYRTTHTHPSVIDVPASGCVADIIPPDVRSRHLVASCTCPLREMGPSIHGRGISPALLTSTPMLQLEGAPAPPLSIPSTHLSTTAILVAQHFGSWMQGAATKISYVHDIDKLKEEKASLRATLTAENTTLVTIRKETAEWEAKLSSVRKEHGEYAKGLVAMKESMAARDAALDERDAMLRGKEALVDQMVRGYFERRTS